MTDTRPDAVTKQEDSGELNAYLARAHAMGKPYARARAVWQADKTRANWMSLVAAAKECNRKRHTQPSHVRRKVAGTIRSHRAQIRRLVYEVDFHRQEVDKWRKECLSMRATEQELMAEIARLKSEQEKTARTETPAQLTDRKTLEGRDMPDHGPPPRKKDPPKTIA